MMNPYLYGVHRYRVTAPMIVAMQHSGGRVQLERGAIVPTDTLSSQLDRLLDEGMIEVIA